MGRDRDRRRKKDGGRRCKHEKIREGLDWVRRGEGSLVYI
jgi:hypothetical protein